MSRYADLLKTDMALNALGVRMIRSAATVEQTAVAMLELTGKFYEALSDLSWHGYLVESAATTPNSRHDRAN